MKKERQDVPDHKTFAKGDPEHLILAQTKPLPDPFEECLMPENERVPRVLFFGFLAHTSILPSTSLRRPAHLLLPRWRLELALLLQGLTMQHLAINPYDEPSLDPPHTGLIRSR